MGGDKSIFRTEDNHFYHKELKDRFSNWNIKTKRNYHKKKNNCNEKTNFEDMHLI